MNPNKPAELLPCCPFCGSVPRWFDPDSKAFIRHPINDCTLSNHICAPEEWSKRASTPHAASEKAVDDFIDRLFTRLEGLGIKTEHWDGDESPEEIISEYILAEIELRETKFYERIEKLANSFANQAIHHRRYHDLINDARARILDGCATELRSLIKPK